MKTLDEWIIASPDKSWEIPIRIAYKTEGVRKFGKFPAKVIKLNPDSYYADEIAVSGPIRPFLCPEPPPDGSSFLLASHNGVEWRQHLPYLHSEEVRQSDDEARRQRFVTAEANTSNERDDVSFLLRVLMRESIAKGDIENALSWAFEAGIIIGRERLKRKVADVLELAAKRDRRDELVEVVTDARSRHGQLLSATKLLKSMGGVREFEYIPEPGGSRRQVCVWRFCNGGKIRQDEFQRAFNQADKRVKNSGEK